MNFAELLDEIDASVFANDPRPGWAGPALLFNARGAPLSALPSTADFIAAGVPFDGTASSRPGACEGPGAIRRASMVFSGYVDSLGEHPMHDMRTGKTFDYRKADVVDAGDLHVYPSDPLRTFKAVASEVEVLAKVGAFSLLFGGDHSISFPTFAGWQRAHAGKRVGYVQVDHHFDFGDNSTIHGPLYHGSNARRISELPGMAPRQMAFVGVGSVTRKAQLDGLLRDGYHVVPACEIDRLGPAVALAPTLAELASCCDAVYLSIDIDVLDCSVAPGTGNVTIGGLSGGQLFDTVAELSRLPLTALDITEVSPRYDPTGRTAQIAARLLFELVYREGGL